LGEVNGKVKDSEQPGSITYHNKKIKHIHTHTQTHTYIHTFDSILVSHFSIAFFV